MAGLLQLSLFFAFGLCILSGCNSSDYSWEADPKLTMDERSSDFEGFNDDPEMNNTQNSSQNENSAIDLNQGSPTSQKDCSGFSGINVHKTKGKLLDKVADGNFHWIRVDFNWSEIQPKKNGGYKWKSLDETISQARSLNLTVFATLAYSPSWASQDGNRASPPSKKAWEDFVSTAVARYKDSIQHWGMWNEPNLEFFWKGSKEDYVKRILKPGYNAVKSVDPSAQVVAPDLAFGKDHHWEEWVRTISKNARASFDIFSFHIYPEEDDGESEGSEPVLNRLDSEVKTLLRKEKLLDRPVWLTEIGWRTYYVSEEEQAQHLVASLKGVKNRNWISKAFIYNIRDGNEKRNKWGLFDSALKPKSAYKKIQSFLAETQSNKDESCR